MPMPRPTARQVREFQTAFDGPVTDLVSVYQRASLRMMELLRSPVAKLAERRRALALLRQYSTILADLQQESAAWIAVNMPAAYETGLAFSDLGLARVRQAGLRLGINVGQPLYTTFAQVHTQAVATLTDEMGRTLDNALALLGRRVEDAFRDVSLREVALGVAQGQSRRVVSANLAEALVQEAGPYFVDRAGRNWPLDTYAEMVARTTTREAATMGTVNRLREHGVTLAQVSAHNADDFCRYYEGAVVCIEGEHPDFPPLSSIGGGPPFHPRCVHVLTPFVLDFASPEELAAGRVPSDVLNQSPASLQRRYREEFGRGRRAA